jgi:oxygen-dependent protoporphyrinogen oxidase
VPSIVIVGGGISGLAAAYELFRARVPFTLLEASTRLGGLIRTEVVGDCVIDAGPDGFLASKPGALELCRELGIDDRLVPTIPPRRPFVVRGGRLHPLPDGTILGVPADPVALAHSTLFTSEERDRIAREWSHPPDPAPASDESIASFFRRRFGNEAVEYLAEPLLAGIHTGDVERLSVGALFPRLVKAAQDGSVSRALSVDLAAADPHGAFRSFRGGLQELTDALARSLDGHDIRAGCGVERIESDGKVFSIALRHGDAITARAVILAVPAYAAGEVVRGLDPALADSCAALPYASSGIVVLAYPRGTIRHPLDGSGFVVPHTEQDVEILAATWLSSKWPGRAPAGTALIRAFFGGTRHPETVANSDDAVIALAHRDLSRLLGIGAAPIVARVYRWMRATPQYEVGMLERFADMKRRLASHPGLFVTGPGFGSIGIPESIAAARAVARCSANER